MNEFTDFDNQGDVPDQMVDTLELTLFDVESKSSQIWSKLRRNLRAHKIQIGDVRCVTVQAKSAEIHSTCPMYVDRAHTHAAVEAVSAVAAAEQHEGWRFVPDTILLGYQWAPQQVPARTPTVHWGPISGKAVGGPNTVQHSRSQCEKHPKYGSGATSIQGKSFGNKSTVDESLLCYGGPRDEEVDETIHENFDEKEKMKHEIKKSVKDGATTAPKSVP